MHTTTRRNAILAVSAPFVSLALGGTVRAQAYPSHAITVVIPFAPGNANDVVGRIVLDQLSRQLGQPIIIENRSGAGGTTGVGFVAKAAPDGYTLLLHSSTFAAAYSLYKSLPYDTFNDFQAIACYGAQPTVLVVAPSKGWKTVAELVAYGKANPGKLNFASAGIGAASHLAAERFRVSAGFEAQHIPFRGPVEALTEVMTGRIDFYFLPVAPALSLIAEHKVVALAVSTEKRANLLPDVPTTAEAGLKNATYVFWNGLFAPAKTPRDIINKLHDESEKALADPAVREKLAKVGHDPLPMTPDQFQKYVADDVRETAKLMTRIGIKPTE